MQFQNDRYDIKGIYFEEIEKGYAPRIATLLMELPPWKKFDHKKLTSYLQVISKDVRRFSVVDTSAMVEVGFLSVKPFWLNGPYIEFLAIYDFQSHGYGSMILEWIESETQKYADNIWVCTGQENTKAQNFYEKNGYKEVACLDNLIKESHAEILYRKKI